MASDPRSARWRPLGGRVLALAGFAALVVLAAGDEATGPSRLSIGVLPDLLLVTVTVLMATFTIILVIASVRPAKGEEDEEPIQSRPRTTLIYLLMLLALVAILAYWRPENLTPEPPPPVELPEVVDDAPIEPGPSPTIGAGQSVGLALLVAVAVATLIWSRRAGRSDDDALTPTAVTRPDLAGAVRQARRRLLADDPRDGVLAAYADLEAALARLDLDRTPSETPSEHQGRVARTLALDPASLGELALRYERARFSDQPVTPTHVDRARSALDQLLLDLEGRQSAEPDTHAPTEITDAVEGPSGS